MLLSNVISQFQNAFSGRYSNEIDDALINYFINKPLEDNEIYDFFKNIELSKDIDVLVKICESLLERKKVEENGMVFTPKYISDYIVSNTLNSISEWSEDITIVDPACGVGIFLISAAEYLNKRFQVPLDKIFKNNIFGIDIDEENVRRCKIVINIYLEQNGYKPINFESNIICEDSLKKDWNKILGINCINYVIGNPPYVNPHSLPIGTTEFLKKNYSTIQTGTANIFYAFIEKSMDELDGTGELGFIIPNNFLSISAASNLRQYLQHEKYVKSIVDFGENMVFKPVRTYSCILNLSKKQVEKTQYSVLTKTENIKDELKSIEFSELNIERLDKNGWHLVSDTVYQNLKKIENQLFPINDYIRTGIATLKDAAYFVEQDNRGYFKLVEGVRYEVESSLVKSIYKIPDLKKASKIDDVKRYIIFPYKHDGTGYSLIPEDEMKSEFPNAYSYFLSIKELLGTRNKGKGIDDVWYAYGRKQGLNKYGAKLLFPTFSNKPKFMLVEDVDSLFCNGYAVFENDVFDLKILLKILNSRIMDYYIFHTSYSIEGGYFCYQKKYIQNFSIPLFESEELEFIKNASEDQLNKFLCQSYGIEEVELDKFGR
ncbi:TPA: N-6 DNA methylase [Streptococcus suis]|nr:N-6 DNA methylase [Streptococcus suis]HEL9638732.1 N-6 DNA methylase [Streptococcus suis]HEM6302251.1 N-6 DNA methylase [Streptococcus suis]